MHVAPHPRTYYYYYYYYFIDAYSVRNIIYRWYPQPVSFKRRELPQFSILVDEITLTNDTDEYDASKLVLVEMK